MFQGVNLKVRTNRIPISLQEVDLKTLLCVISPICCKLSCYDDVGFFAKEKCEKSKKLNVK